MIWNRKSYPRIQIYKLKGKDDFILVDLETMEYLGELFTHPKPGEVTMSMGTTDWKFLTEECYPVSQKRLRRFKDSEKWEKAFQEHYFDWEEDNDE